MHQTIHLLRKTDFPRISRRSFDTLQVNLGYKCNQSCVHCHVNAGPNRTEMMPRETIELVLAVLKRHQVKTLDLTGGAPELNDHFRYLVTRARALGVHVIDRCNLTILSEPGQEDLAEFLASNGVEVVASMPCYSVERVDKQRGEGVFDLSIKGLQTLNSLGYGRDDPKLALNLVYNPLGASLPPNQAELQIEYKRELATHFGISFDKLYALANMPIQRFGSTLVSKGTFKEYMELLRGAYQHKNLEGVMCSSMLSVDWQGDLYDCDFNQMLGLSARLRAQRSPHLHDLLTLDPIGEEIQIADHCYGCTAGQGSSCGGALKSNQSEFLQQATAQ